MGVFVDALSECPEALLEFARLTSRRRRALAKRVGDLVLRDAAPGLACLLLDLAQDFGRETDDGTVIEIVRTHHDLAEDLAARRPTVSKLLGQFRGDGLIANQGRFLVVTDATRLQAIADTNTGRTP